MRWGSSRSPGRSTLRPYDGSGRAGHGRPGREICRRRHAAGRANGQYGRRSKPDLGGTRRGLHNAPHGGRPRDQGGDQARPRQPLGGASTGGAPPCPPALRCKRPAPQAAETFPGSHWQR
eukprot:12848055-Heterocapsa_arctica.AAC.1